MTEIFNYLKRHRYQLPPQDFFLESNSKHFPCIHTLVMCNFGFGRSAYVAEDLTTSYLLPSLYVSGGLDQIKDLNLPDQARLLEIFSTFPVVVALLTSVESQIYKAQLSKLSHVQVYSNLNLAIRKVVSNS